MYCQKIIIKSSCLVQIYSVYAPYQFLAYWHEMWRDYEKLLGPFQDLHPDEYKSFTGGITSTQGLDTCATGFACMETWTCACANHVCTPFLKDCRSRGRNQLCRQAKHQSAAEQILNILYAAGKNMRQHLKGVQKKKTNPSKIKKK